MAAIVPQPWTFKQLGPPNGILTLDGSKAPFGRPRKGAVVEKERELRESETYYSGNNVPTRHIFGDRQTPITLVGRFMDSRIGGAGSAQHFYDQLDDYVKAQIPVQAQWGGIYAATGLLTKLKGSFESAEEIAWSLTMKVDSDDTKPIQAPVAPAPNASNLLDQVKKRTDFVTTQIRAIPPDIQYTPSFLDGLANLISTLNSIPAAFANFAASVDNFESALSCDVAHFRAGLALYSTTWSQLQLTLAAAENDPAIVAARGPSQTAWYSSRTEMEEQALEVLGILAVLDLTAEIALKGQPDVTYSAKSGDTWEAIALAKLGSVSRADDLRQANGFRYGAQPTPGQVIHIPKQ